MILLCQTPVLQSMTYDVGPGYLFSTPLFVPWQKLEPGDVVNIHWRSRPYRARWVVCRLGTALAPIIIRGISNAEGKQPIIEGDGAFTAPHLDYSGGNRALIRIGEAKNTGFTEPAYIVVENLHLRGANHDNHFHLRDGSPEPYVSYAAGIHIERGHHITIHNCSFENNGNGLMTSHRSKDVVVDGCHFFNNGYVKDAFHHNLYSATLNLTIRNNRFCPLKEGSLGNNIKDRSAGLHIHHNTIYGGNKLLDIVDAEDSEVLRQHPSYPVVLVENNLLIKRNSSETGRVVNFGGDSEDVTTYRTQLVFRNNTVLTEHKGTTILFRAETNEQHILAQNNVFHQIVPEEIDTRWQLVHNKCYLKLKDNQITGRWIDRESGISFRFQPRITGQSTFIRNPPVKDWIHPTPRCEHHSN